MSSSARGTSLKRATAEEKRRLMNERRHEYQSKIRKAKKSHLVTLKRRYNAAESSAPPMTQATTSLQDLANTYMNQRDVSSLAALQSALATCREDAAVAVLQVSNPELLANTLASSLNNTASLEERLLASRVLTNLAAMSTFTSTSGDDYYQKQPQGWCHILIHSQALPALAEALANFAIQVDPTYMSSDGPLLEVCLQCCWAVGNICGDSQAARDAARHEGVVPSLTTVLQKGMELHHNGICRNAAWALSNLTRGGVTTSGREFCGPSLLTPTLLASVLMSPEQHVNAIVQQTWWTDVANECAWILAFLTAREDEVVSYLCQATNELAWLLIHPNKSQHVVAAALAHRLEEASRAAVSSSTATTASSSTHASAALRMTIPCLRSIGNIATACQGQYVGILLQETSILESLKILIEAAVNKGRGGGGDVAAVAVEAAWAAGTLVCDAGLPDHASTTCACPFLLPILCHVVTNGCSKLDLKREAVSALWNAVSAPPKEDVDNVVSSSRPLRDEFLAQIATTPGMIPCLTELLTSMDTDASFVSIQLLNAMLRRLQTSLPTVRREFLEANGLDALEAVCDGASQAHAYGVGQDWSGGDGNNDSAEIAANLIDDLFSDDYNNDDTPLSMDEGMILPSSFTFSPIAVNPQQQQVFDFGGSQMQAFPNTQTAGAGKGRGKPIIPSWMNQS